MTCLTSVSVWSFRLTLFFLVFNISSCGVKAPPKSSSLSLPSIDAPYIEVKKDSSVTDNAEDVEKEEN
ncbi:hypothetical protein M899_3465 [Bacteriovorax sp. BSW11_IV]|uniref:hypothetical protein n=1 Tax=Bacteriovorax sp. BSW11_IV TaxID=1353529 RepID=UPI00038A0623|nr:hypothetical protein [Bacteriovorax sp. BSW11_IV]EQC45155.1 hypothetical protein M899_3465 [Bacteriovorax sp. BSW11_IV]